MFYDFLDFNAKLFDKKMHALGGEEFAKDFIEKVTIPDYIREIRQSNGK